MSINKTLQRGISLAQNDALTLAYKSSNIFHTEVRFPREAVSIIRDISKLRMKDYASTSRWNPVAEETGFFGEMAVSRYFEVSVARVIDDFVMGLQGDKGHDITLSSLNLDVKSTRGTALKFKFSKSNRYRNLADGFIFCAVEEVGSEVWVRLLGYSLRSDIKPYQRDDGQKLFVRVETLRRAGVLRAVNLLKPEIVTNSSVNQ